MAAEARKSSSASSPPPPKSRRLSVWAEGVTATALGRALAAGVRYRPPYRRETRATVVPHGMWGASSAGNEDNSKDSGDHNTLDDCGVDDAEGEEDAEHRPQRNASGMFDPSREVRVDEWEAALLEALPAPSWRAALHSDCRERQMVSRTADFVVGVVIFYRVLFALMLPDDTALHARFGVMPVLLVIWRASLYLSWHVVTQRLDLHLLGAARRSKRTESRFSADVNQTRPGVLRTAVASAARRFCRAFSALVRAMAFPLPRWLWSLLGALNTTEALALNCAAITLLAMNWSDLMTSFQTNTPAYLVSVPVIVGPLLGGRAMCGMAAAVACSILLFRPAARALLPGTFFVPRLSEEEAAFINWSSDTFGTILVFVNMLLVQRRLGLSGRLKRAWSDQLAHDIRTPLHGAIGMHASATELVGGSHREQEAIQIIGSCVNMMLEVLDNALSRDTKGPVGVGATNADEGESGLRKSTSAVPPGSRPATKSPQSELPRATVTPALDSMHASGDAEPRFTFVELMRRIRFLGASEAGRRDQVVAVSLELDHGTAGTCTVDQEAVRVHGIPLSDLVRIVTNLVSNASKFSPAGSELRIRVVASLIEDQETINPGRKDEASEVVRPRGVRLTLHVEDQGPGIPVSQHDRIFRAFEQVRTSHQKPHATEGVGLGLSIVQQIVFRLGGTVSVSGRSDGATGALFSVSLPCRFSCPSADLVTATPPDSPLVPLPEWSQRLRVLLCDDNFLNCRLLERMLFRLGIQSENITVCNSGEDVRPFLRAPTHVDVGAGPPSFDVAIVDLVLPGIDGIEVTKEIFQATTAVPARKDSWDHSASVVVVGCSASMTKVIEERWRTSGAALFMPKPFQVSDVRQVLQASAQILDVSNLRPGRSTERSDVTPSISEANNSGVRVEDDVELRRRRISQPERRGAGTRTRETEGDTVGPVAGKKDTHVPAFTTSVSDAHEDVVDEPVLGAVEEVIEAAILVNVLVLLGAIAFGVNQFTLTVFAALCNTSLFRLSVQASPRLRRVVVLVMPAVEFLVLHTVNLLQGCQGSAFLSMHGLLLIAWFGPWRAFPWILVESLLNFGATVVFRDYACSFVMFPMTPEERTFQELMNTAMACLICAIHLSQIARVEEERDIWTATLSHDLRTPLHAMFAAIEEISSIERELVDRDADGAAVQPQLLRADSAPLLPVVHALLEPSADPPLSLKIKSRKETHEPNWQSRRLARALSTMQVFTTVLLGVVDTVLAFSAIEPMIDSSKGQYSKIMAVARESGLVPPLERLKIQDLVELVQDFLPTVVDSEFVERLQLSGIHIGERLSSGLIQLTTTDGPRKPSHNKLKSALVYRSAMVFAIAKFLTYVPYFRSSGERVRIDVSATPARRRNTIEEDGTPATLSIRVAQPTPPPAPVDCSRLIREQDGGPLERKPSTLCRTVDEMLLGTISWLDGQPTGRGDARGCGWWMQLDLPLEDATAAVPSLLASVRKPDDVGGRSESHAQPQPKSEQSPVFLRAPSSPNWIHVSVAHVDDSALSLRVMERMLEHLGVLEVRSFSDPREAQRALRDGELDTFQVFITDLNMPELSGVELARDVHDRLDYLSAADNTPVDNLRVILSTADPLGQAKGHALGFLHVINKPFSPEQLRDMLQQTLQTG
jgi:signal transduction histidine kinase/DNA-binding response OmpR family regulator